MYIYKILSQNAKELDDGCRSYEMPPERRWKQCETIKYCNFDVIRRRYFLFRFILCVGEAQLYNGRLLYMLNIENDMARVPHVFPSE